MIDRPLADPAGIKDVDVNLTNKEKKAAKKEQRRQEQLLFGSDPRQAAARSPHDKGKGK